MHRGRIGELCPGACAGADGRAPAEPVSWSPAIEPGAHRPAPPELPDHESTCRGRAVGCAPARRAGAGGRAPADRFRRPRSHPRAPAHCPALNHPPSNAGGSCAPPRETWSRPHQLRGRPEFLTTMVVSVLSTTSVRVVVQDWSVLSVTRIGVPGSRSFLGSSATLGPSRQAPHLPSVAVPMRPGCCSSRGSYHPAASGGAAPRRRCSRSDSARGSCSAAVVRSPGHLESLSCHFGVYRPGGARDLRGGTAYGACVAFVDLDFPR